MGDNPSKDHKVERVCVFCGKTYMALESRHSIYCSQRCLSTAHKRKASEAKKANRERFNALKVDCPDMTEEYLAKRVDNIIHQQDRSVWTNDYAERQKAKTLAMIGGIKV